MNPASAGGFYIPSLDGADDAAIRMTLKLFDLEAIPNPTYYSKNSAYYLRIDFFCGRLTYYLFDYSFET